MAFEAKAVDSLSYVGEKKWTLLLFSRVLPWEFGKPWENNTKCGFEGGFVEFILVICVCIYKTTA